MLKEIDSLDELNHNKKYCYHEKTDDKHTFIVKRHDLTNKEHKTIQLKYKDGYVADVPVDNIQEHISKGAVYKYV